MKRPRKAKPRLQRNSRTVPSVSSEAEPIETPESVGGNRPAVINPTNALRKLGALDWLVLAILCAAIGYQFFVHPIVGLADNGDFYRTSIVVQLSHTAQNFHDQYFGWYNRLYAFNRNPIPSEFVTSQHLFLYPSVWLNALLRRDGLYDLRSLAVVYAAFYLSVIGALLVYSHRLRPPARWLLIALFLIVMADVSYIAYFNSFYSEPATFVFLLASLAATLFMLDGPSYPRLAACLVFYLLFVGAKPQNVVSGLFLGIFLWRAAVLQAGRRWKQACGAAGVAMIAGSAMYYAATPQASIVRPTYYVAVFYGILLDSPTPKTDLADLGLSPELAKYAGTTPYDESKPLSNPVVEAEFFRKIGFGKIIRYYLTHPRRLYFELDRDAKFALGSRAMLGNFEKSAGEPYGQTSRRFSLWSQWKALVFPASAWSLLVCLLTAFGMAAFAWKRAPLRKDRLLVEFFALLLVLASLQFVLVSVTQSIIDPAKHLFLFSALFDICLVMSLAWAAGRVSSGKQEQVQVAADGAPL